MVLFAASVTDYKASLFALMAYTLRTDLKAAEQVARYLFYRAHVLDRHPEVSIYHLHCGLDVELIGWYCLYKRSTPNTNIKRQIWLSTRR